MKDKSYVVDARCINCGTLHEGLIVNFAVPVHKVPCSNCGCMELMKVVIPKKAE